ncbi:MAG: two-component system, OmpR family, response regulator [Acidobacteriota bacterium]|jgi:DNA-binding response OmpR family regulator|nr:two-component system, OmpR family, response regulator [Acidobacteriota bacterium]
MVADSAGLNLQQQLTAHGYLTQACSVTDASRTIKEFEPDVLIMLLEYTADEVENEHIALARKLRADTLTYSLPIVFAWREDERSLRAAAQYTGADDYFPLATTPAEVLARLDSLFWRVESDRRAAPVMSDRRLEIDNFMFMLDAVREDLRAHQNGTLALIYAVSTRRKDEALDRAVRDRTLTEAHNFLRLNLRRIDAVAYYGPTTLLIYLPRMDAQSAAAALSRLHREFRAEHPDRDMVAGVASFPANGTDVERLIEKAEEAVNKARRDAGEKHVLISRAAPEAAPTQAAPESDREAAPTEVAPEPDREAAPTEVAPQSPREVAPVEEPPVPVAEVAQPAQSHHAEDEQVVNEAALEPAAVHDAASVENVANDTKTEAPSETPDGANEAAAREMERRASGAVMPRRLLLTVSDGARMTQLNALIRSAGYEARAAFSGQQALALLRIESQDLLLVDYELEGIDGLETIRRLRKQSGGRLTLPVIMLLSSNNESARREALDLGARSVHQIPYDPAELLASLRLAGSVE